MIRRGCLFALLGILGGLSLLFEGADVAARHYATTKIEEHIRASAPEAQGVRARIRGWPFLKILVNGHVDVMGAHITRVVERGLAFTDVDLELHGIKIDQAKLISENRVAVQSIRTGTVTASITAGDLTSAVGVPLTITSSGVALRGAPVRVAINAAARTLVVSPAGLAALSLPLPGANLLPCVPAVAYAADRVTLSCTFTHVPSAFSTAVS
jgi:hypothetical protein